MSLIESPPAKKSRLRQLPISEWLICTKTQARQVVPFGRRKIDQLCDEGRLETVVVGHRVYIRVPSLLRLLDEGAGLKLPEPFQLARAKAAKVSS